MSTETGLGGARGGGGESGGRGGGEKGSMRLAGPHFGSLAARVAAIIKRYREGGCRRGEKMGGVCDT